MVRLVELRWNCQYCGTTDILGRHQECPNCHRKRDTSFKAHLPDDIKANYVSEEKAKKISRNPDWFCSYCGTFNPDSETKCTSCFSPKSESKYNYFTIHDSDEEVTRKVNQNVSQNEVKKNNLYQTDSYKTNSSRVNNNNSLPLNQILKIAFISILFIFIICGLISVFTPKEISLQITNLSWTRTIYIEEYKTVEESAWSLPTGSRLIKKETEFHHYDFILDHYETKTREVAKERIVGYETYYTYHDLGNGYAEEEEHSRPIYETYYETEEYDEPVYVKVPIYQTKYYYEIDKWVYKRSIITSESNKNPYWGELILRNNERESSRNEFFYIDGITADKKNVHYSISSSDWKNLNIGQNVKLKVIAGYAQLIE